MFCKEEKFWVLAMTSGGSAVAPAQTYSLEYLSAECTLGDDGARYRTPETRGGVEALHADVSDAQGGQTYFK